jgi:Eph receptor B1
VTTYRFQVFAENGVSPLVGRSEYVDITVTTEASVPSLVSNVRITNVKSSELSISWDAPINDVGGDSDLVERYEGTIVITKMLSII